MTRRSCIQIAAGILIRRVRDARAVIASLLRRAGRDAAVAMLSVFMGITTAHAGVITFNDLVLGDTVFDFDVHGDGKADFRFSTTDPLGFRTAGPGPNMTYIDEPGMEGTSLLPTDLRIDFLSGTNSLKFGFALNSAGVTGAASATVYDKSGAVLASKSVVGQFTTTPLGQSSFPEGELSLSFAKTAAYATLDFTSDFGRYIIDNVSIGAATQTVFLDFAADPDAVFATPGKGVAVPFTYDKPTASLGTGGDLTGSQIADILAINQSIYSNYLVDFTTTEPTSGDFSTIFIGGTSADIPGSNTGGIAGIAQMRDYGNQNRNDTAVVFSGLSFFNNNIASLAQVIAHEIGHLLGLAHVTDPRQLLYPTAPTAAEALGGGRTAIGGPTPVAADGSTAPIVPSLSQDSAALLDCFVGSRSLDDYLCTPSALASVQALTVRTSGTSLSSTVYDAKLVLANEDDDAGPTIIDLGTLTPGPGAFFYIPRIPGLQGFLVGASIAGGPADIFSGDPSGISGDPADYATFAQELIDSSGKLDVGNLALFQLAGGVFSPLGEVSVSAVPEPGSLWLMLGMLAWLLCWHGRATARVHVGRRYLTLSF